MAVLQGSAADGFLTRTLTRAQIIRIVDGLVSAREALSFGRADVFADYTHIAYLVQAEVPGAIVLITPFSVVRMTVAIPKSNAAALPIVNDFIVKAKKDGVITDAIKKSWPERRPSCALALRFLGKRLGYFPRTDGG